MPTINAGDMTVYYLEQGAGTPVVFVHGNWVTSTCWEPLLQRMPAGLRGIAYDLRGRGKTEAPDHDYSMPAMAGDLLAFVDALGLERFHLVGLSLGTAIAMQFGLDYPNRLLSLALISPAWVDGMPEAFNVPAGQEMLKADKALYAKSLKALAPLAAEDELWQRVVDEGHQQSISATMANLPALLNWKPANQLQSIPVPKLLISGSLDPITGPTAARAAEALGTSVTLLEGIGHTPPLEAPDQTIALLTSFWGGIV